MTGTWGRAGGLQGGGGRGREWKGSRLGRLRLRPHVKAPRGKGRPGGPFRPPTPATPTLPPARPSTHTHTHTHTSEARLGVGRPGDQRLSRPHHFLLNVSKINRTSKGNSPNSPGGWLEGRTGGGCQPPGDFSLRGGSNMCPGITFWKLPSSLAGHKVCAELAARRTHSPG